MKVDMRNNSWSLRPCDLITSKQGLLTQLPIDNMVVLSLALSKKIDEDISCLLSVMFWEEEEVLGWHSSQQQQQQSINAWPRVLHRHSKSTGVTDDLKNKKN